MMSAASPSFTAAWNSPSAATIFARRSLCVPRTSSGVLKVRPGNIGDEGRQEQAEM